MPLAKTPPTPRGWCKKSTKKFEPSGFRLMIMNPIQKTPFAASGQPRSRCGPFIDRRRRSMLVRSLAMLLIPPPLAVFAHPKGYDMQSADNSAILTARLQIDPGAIGLHYEVKNTSGVEIFLFNQT